MVRIAVSGKLEAPADEVWALVGPFGNLEKFDPGIVRSPLEEGGILRRLDIVDSGQIVERLLSYDHAGRRYHWKIVEIVDVPMPIVDYFATISVADDEPGRSSVFEMSARFDPAEGESERAVEELMSADFRAVVENLKTMFNR